MPLDLVAVIAETAVCAVVLSSVVGFAPVELLLGGSLRRYHLLLVPTVGIAVTEIIASVLDTYLLPLKWVGWPLLGTFLIVDIVLLIVRTRQQRALVKGLSRDDVRELTVPALLGAVLFVVGIAPLISYGFPTTIGANWDPEIYLTLADFIARYRISSGIPFTANPMVQILNGPIVRAEGGWGFSHFQALVDVLTGFPAFATYAPLIAFFASLQVFGAWILFRLFRLSRKVAAFAVVLLIFNGLLLWSAYFGFPSQAVALALLPCLFAVFIQSFDDLRWETGLLCAILLAGLCLVYYRAAGPLLVFPLALLVLRRVIQRSSVRGLLRQVAWILGGTLVFSVVAQSRLVETIPYLRTSEPSVGPGVQDFVSPGTAFGLVPFPANLGGLEQLLGHPRAAHWAEVVVSMLAGALVLYAIGRRGRTDLGALGLGYLASLAVLVVVLQYPYGFLKALSVMACVSTLLLAVGLADIHDFARKLWRPAAVLAPALGATVAAVVGVNGLVVVDYYVGTPPQLYGTSLVELNAVRQLIPAGSNVQVSDAPELQGTNMGFIADVLVDDRVYGDLHTGYSAYSRQCPCALADYAIYPAKSVPEPPFSAYETVWKNAEFKLLRRPADLVYAFEQGDGTVLRDGASYSMLLQVPTQNSPATPVIGDQPPGPYDITIELSAVTQTRVGVAIADHRQTVDLASGQATSVELKDVTLPNVVTLELEKPGVLVIRNTLAWRPGRAARALNTTEDALFLSRHATISSGTADLEIGYAALGTATVLQPVIDIYDDDGQHYGWWSVNPGSEDGLRRVSFRLNLATKDGRVTVDGKAAGGSQAGKSGDGTFTASLYLWKSGQVLRAVPLFRFTLLNGSVAQFTPLDGTDVVELGN